MFNKARVRVVGNGDVQHKCLRPSVFLPPKREKALLSQQYCILQAAWSTLFAFSWSLITPKLDLLQIYLLVIKTREEKHKKRKKKKEKGRKNERKNFPSLFFFFLLFYFSFSRFYGQKIDL